MDTLTKIGIDAGGTLIKIAGKSDQGLERMTFPVQQAEKAAAWINASSRDPEIGVTGGKASLFSRLLTGKDVTPVSEFEASCLGARYLLKEAHGPEPESFILTNVGTGTSIHRVEQDQNERVAGTGVGGGTIVGLSGLLTGIFNYEKLVHLAGSGKRNHVDLTVAHLYGHEKPPIPGDLTASNFGLLNHAASMGQASDADKLATVIGLVGEVVATMSVLAAERFDVTCVVYIGSAFVANPLLEEIVTSYGRFRGTDTKILENGQYSGAIGALMMLKK